MQSLSDKKIWDQGCGHDGIWLELMPLIHSRVNYCVMIASEWLKPGVNIAVNGIANFTWTVSNNVFTVRPNGQTQTLIRWGWVVLLFDMWDLAIITLGVIFGVWGLIWYLSWERKI